jgi:uncharacterized protein YkwD
MRRRWLHQVLLAAVPVVTAAGIASALPGVATSARAATAAAPTATAPQPSPAPSPASLVLPLPSPLSPISLTLPVSVLPAPSPVPALQALFPTETRTVPEMQAALLADVNASRAAGGLGPLALQPWAQSVALAHAEDMASARDLWHNYPGYVDVARQAIDAYVDGENVGMAQTLDAVNAALLASPTHRANILYPLFNAVGIGVARDADGYIYVTEDFADIRPPAAVAAPAAGGAAAGTSAAAARPSSSATPAAPAATGPPATAIVVAEAAPLAAVASASQASRAVAAASSGAPGTRTLAAAATGLLALSGVANTLRRRQRTHRGR